MTTTDERERTVAMVHRCAQHQDVEATWVLASSAPAVPASASTGMTPSDAGVEGHVCGRSDPFDGPGWCSLVVGHVGNCVWSGAAQA